MPKKCGLALRHCLGFLCLFTGPLLSTSQAESSSIPPSPLTRVSPSGRLQHYSRIVPSRMTEIHRAGTQQGAHAAASPEARPADAGSSPAAPNFGGFSGDVPTFPVAHVIDTYNSAGYAIKAYDTSAAVAGDFNGDGKLDIAAVQMDGSIDVLLGDGKGGFSAPAVTASTIFSFESDSVVAVDLNGDGKQDLVGYSGAGGGLLVWLSKGDGTFAAPAAPTYNYQNKNVAFAFSVADVNGDGHPDILLASDTGGTPDAIQIQTLLNAGDGTFPAAKNIPTSSYALPGGYVASTLANTASVVQIDGKPTLFFEAGEAGVSGPPYSAEIFQAVSNGDGTFTFKGAPLDIPSIYGSTLDFRFSGAGRALLVQDLNGDGTPDILSVPGDGAIYSALGTGGGNFAVPVLAYSETVFDSPDLLAVDLDGDGIADLVDSEYGSATAFRGNGDGTFVLVNATMAGAGSNSNGFTSTFASTAYGDFNGDGKLDYFSVDSNYGSGALHAGLGGFNFTGTPRLVDTGAADQLPAIPAQLVVEAALDLNGDGKTDLVAFNESYRASGYTLNAVSGINQGNGTFKWVSAPSLLALSQIAQFGISSTTGDFNHDGKQDIIVYGANAPYGFLEDWFVYVALSNGDGTFQAPIQIQLPNQPVYPQSLSFAVADVNGDGNPDVVITNGYASGSFIFGGPPAGYYVALGDGTGKFPTVTFTPYGTSLNLAALADFNGDGAPDLAVSNFPNGKFPSLSVLLNDGKGNFSTSSAKPISYTEYPVFLNTGDLAKNGKQDLIVASAGVYDSATQAIDSSQAGLVIYPGNGDGTMGEPVTLDPQEGPAFVLADFNGDGFPDILAGLSYDFSPNPPSITDQFYGASLLLNTGNGDFAAPRNMYVPYGLNSVTAGNFYGDGVKDLLEVDGGGASVFFNQGGSSLTLSASDVSVVQGDTEIITAKVVPGLPGRPDPTGNLTFYDGGATLGVASIDSTGAASYSTTGLAAGAHAITASYAGDANFNPVSQPVAVSIAVTALPPAFDLAAGNSSLTIGRKGSGSLTLTLTPNATFRGNVSLAVTGFPAGVTAQFTPASVQLSPGGQAKVTVTISAGAATTASLKGYGTGWSGAGAGASLAGLLLLGIPRRRRILRMFLFFAAVSSTMALLSLTGCGGGSSQSVKAGSSQITITATPSVSGAVPQSTTVTLTIQ